MSECAFFSIKCLLVFVFPIYKKCKIPRNIHRKSYYQFPFKGTKANNVDKKSSRKQWNYEKFLKFQYFVYILSRNQTKTKKADVYMLLLRQTCNR